jgi:multidrug efflux pump subunit AcrA (membrane-fusion protein)
MARRPALATLALAALAAGAIVVAVLVVGSPDTSSAQERTATVERGVIQATVSGSGNLEPANQADVDFATSGEITHVYVEVGQHVSKDEILAKVDPASANVDLAQAEADLQSAQDALDQANAAASTTTTTATTAQSSGSKSPSDGPTSGSDSGATSTMTVAAAQANVDSAQLSVESAEKAVAATTLRAPMAGTVTAVNGSVGQTVSSGSSSSSSSSSSTGSTGPSVTGGLGGGGADSSSSSSSSGGSSFITLAQVSRFKMEVSLSESDIGSVKVGQPATVTVNAASGEQFAARVADIGVLSSTASSGSSSNAVSYPVTLSLDQTGRGLKAGMSATADIVTSQVTGMALPSQALTGSSVTVQAADGTQTTRQVQTGVVGDSTTQVISGLKVGDKVVVRSTAALGTAQGGSNQLNSAIRNRLGGGGLGGGLGGGGFAGGGGAGGFGGPGGRTP